MTANKSGGPPDPGDGRPRVPEWMGGVGIGQLHILSLEAMAADKRLSPFVVGKSLQQAVGEIESATTEAGGLRYVLRVRDAAQVNKLLALKHLFDGTEIKIQLHPVLNTRRCVISCREILNEKEEEIAKWLAEEGVTAVRRITRMDNGNRINTPTLILTINGTVVPEHIRVGPLRIKTRTYIPDPMLCFHCYAYGHTKLRCKSGAKCRNCSGCHETTSECNAEAFCFHCKGKHSPASRQCPKYAAEKEILRIQHTKGISHQEAAKQLEAGGGSFAAVSKIQQRLTIGQQPPTEELKEKDALIKQLSETIAVLSRRVEELERKKTKKDKKQKQRQSTTLEEDLTALNMEYESCSELDSETGACGGSAPQKKEHQQPKEQQQQQQPKEQQVGGAFSKPIPSGFKRQHTSTDLTLPSKKTPDQFPPPSTQTTPNISHTKQIPKQNPPRPQSQQTNSHTLRK
jgi:hypothetical protein